MRIFSNSAASLKTTIFEGVCSNSLLDMILAQALYNGCFVNSGDVYIHPKSANYGKFYLPDHDLAFRRQALCFANKPSKRLYEAMPDFETNNINMVAFLVSQLLRFCPRSFDDKGRAEFGNAIKCFAEQIKVASEKAPSEIQILPVISTGKDDEVAPVSGETLLNADELVLYPSYSHFEKTITEGFFYVEDRMIKIIGDWFSSVELRRKRRTNDAVGGKEFFIRLDTRAFSLNHAKLSILLAVSLCSSKLGSYFRLDNIFFSTDALILLSKGLLTTVAAPYIDIENTASLLPDKYLFSEISQEDKYDHTSTLSVKTAVLIGNEVERDIRALSQCSDSAALYSFLDLTSEYWSKSITLDMVLYSTQLDDAAIVEVKHPHVQEAETEAGIEINKPDVKLDVKVLNQMLLNMLFQDSLEAVANGKNLTMSTPLCLSNTDFLICLTLLTSGKNVELFQDELMPDVLEHTLEVLKERLPEDSESIQQLEECVKAKSFFSSRLITDNPIPSESSFVASTFLQDCLFCDVVPVNAACVLSDDVVSDRNSIILALCQNFRKAVYNEGEDSDPDIARRRNAILLNDRSMMFNEAAERAIQDFATGFFGIRRDNDNGMKEIRKAVSFLKRFLACNIALSPSLLFHSRTHLGPCDLESGSRWQAVFSDAVAIDIAKRYARFFQEARERDRVMTIFGGLHTLAEAQDEDSDEDDDLDDFSEDEEFLRITTVLDYLDWINIELFENKILSHACAIDPFWCSVFFEVVPEACSSPLSLESISLNYRLLTKVVIPRVDSLLPGFCETASSALKMLGLRIRRHNAREQNADFAEDEKTTSLLNLAQSLRNVLAGVAATLFSKQLGSTMLVEKGYIEVSEDELDFSVQGFGSVFEVASDNDDRCWAVTGHFPLGLHMICALRCFKDFFGLFTIGDGLADSTRTLELLAKEEDPAHPELVSLMNSVTLNMSNFKDRLVGSAISRLCTLLQIQYKRRLSEISFYSSRSNRAQIFTIPTQVFPKISQTGASWQVEQDVFNIETTPLSLLFNLKGRGYIDSLNAFLFHSSADKGPYGTNAGVLFSLLYAINSEIIITYAYTAKRRDVLNGNMHDDPVARFNLSGMQAGDLHMYTHNGRINISVSEDFSRSAFGFAPLAIRANMTIDNVMTQLQVCLFTMGQIRNEETGSTLHDLLYRFLVNLTLIRASMRTNRSDATKLTQAFFGDFSLFSMLNDRDGASLSTGMDSVKLIRDTFNLLCNIFITIRDVKNPLSFDSDYSLLSLLFGTRISIANLRDLDLGFSVDRDNRTDFNSDLYSDSTRARILSYVVSSPVVELCLFMLRKYEGTRKDKLDISSAEIWTTISQHLQRLLLLPCCITENLRFTRRSFDHISLVNACSCLSEKLFREIWPKLHEELVCLAEACAKNAEAGTITKLADDSTVIAALDNYLDRMFITGRDEIDCVNHFRTELKLKLSDSGNALSEAELFSLYDQVNSMKWFTFSADYGVILNSVGVINNDNSKFREASFSYHAGFETSDNALSNIIESLGIDEFFSLRRLSV